MIKNSTANPKKIFLMDGIGAILTATSLFVVLIPYEKQFGMPQEVLYFLSVVACIFSIYSICCSYMINQQWPAFLRAIAIANSMYCVLTIIFLVSFSESLTWLGFVYFIGEIIILSTIVYVELKTVSKNMAA